MSSGLLPLSLFANWLATGERGISSDTIVGHLTATNMPQRPSHPYDPSDLRRCERLLRQVPLARLAFPTMMRDASPVWARLVDEWDALVALMEQEIPGCFDGDVRGSAPLTYERMQELRKSPAIPGVSGLGGTNE